MARWEPDSRGRLIEAALQLYSEKGYEATTVAEIAARAGLTERTFFRYFADKREVLFNGSEGLEQILIDAIDDAPGQLAPLDAIAAGLDAIAAQLQQREPFGRRRNVVIHANPELLERELMKFASMTEATAAALRRRGVTETSADIAAEAGMSLFNVGFQRWMAQPDGPGLAHHMHAALDDLLGVAARCPVGGRGCEGG